jgi:hypothetical protein
LQALPKSTLAFQVSLADEKPRAMPSAVEDLDDDTRSSDPDIV